MAITNRILFEEALALKFEDGPSLRRCIQRRRNASVSPEAEAEADAEAEDIEDPELDLYAGNFLKLAKKKWREANGRRHIFDRKFARWLDEEADAPAPPTAKPTPSTTPKKTTPTTTPRKKKPFSELSDRSKRRETAELRKENPTTKLLQAAKTALKNEGEYDFAFVMEKAGETPTRASKLRRLSGLADAMETVPTTPLSLPTKISPTDGLIHLFHSNMTQEAYISNRLISKEHGADIWPSYVKVQAEKKHARPENIKFEETSAIVPLADRLRHNDKRIAEVFAERIQELLQDVPDGGTLEVVGESKAGFDGSTGNSVYQQAFSLENRDTTEESLLSTCIVPLQYRTVQGDIIFINPVPQGPTICQPVRLEYRKETPAASKEIDDWLKDGAESMPPHIVQVGEKFLKFTHIVRRTMLDGKAKNAVTDTASSQRCFLCGATSSQFNNLENLAASFPTKEEALEYGGVCDLHAILRAFDAINTLSDKLNVKAWKPRTNADKEDVKKRKEARQKKFRERLGLVVDVPRSGGAGNSNTGNVARKAFRNEEIFAEITEVDPNLIHRINVLLIAINVDHAIDLKALKAYGFETAKLWVEKYPWCYMPTTLHQLFLHSWESIPLSSLPLSFFSEQSLESTNKFFKADRLHHARKDSRLHTIQDQFFRQSDKSDILIALGLWEKRKKKHHVDLPRDVQDLLVGGGQDDEGSDDDNDDNGEVAEVV